MRATTPRELHALMAFAQELHAIKARFAQREWAMHDSSDFVDNLTSPEAPSARKGSAQPPSTAAPLRLPVNRSSLRR